MWTPLVHHIVLGSDWLCKKVIGNIFRKSLRLSGRVCSESPINHTLRIDISRQARLEHNAGKITTMISTDTTRLDFATTMVHMYVADLFDGPITYPLSRLWISPIMVPQTLSSDSTLSNFSNRFSLELVSLLITWAPPASLHSRSLSSASRSKASWSN